MNVLLLAAGSSALMPKESLATNFAKRSEVMVTLFRDWWLRIAAGAVSGRPQPAGGSHHCLKDKAPYSHLVTRGWETPVSCLVDRALPKGGDRQP